MAQPNKSKTKEDIESLDSKFKSIQHNADISISSAKSQQAERQKVAPMAGVLNEPHVDMDGLMNSMEKLKDSK